jgi:hypothetical protein
MDLVVESAADGKARSDGDLRNRVSHAVDRFTKLVGTCYDRTCTTTAGLTITLGHNYETACKPTHLGEVDLFYKIVIMSTSPPVLLRKRAMCAANTESMAATPQLRLSANSKRCGLLSHTSLGVSGQLHSCADSSGISGTLGVSLIMRSIMVDTSLDSRLIEYRRVIAGSRCRRAD